MSLSKRFRAFVEEFNNLQSLGGRKDSVSFQTKVSKLIKELTQLEIFIQQLNLFSENESIDELNPLYIQYLNIEFYYGCLYSNYLLNPNTNTAVEISDGQVSPIDFKSINLTMSKSKLIHYLISLEGFKVLSTIQSKKLNSFKDSFNPTYQELANSLNSNPATKRAEKIENYKLEKSLTTKLEILNDYYKTRKDDDDEDDNEQDEDVFERFDEETIRAIYIDQLKLFSLTSFNMLELIVMESEVLSKRPQHIEQQDRMQVNKGDSRENSKFDSHNEYGYTSKLEKVYNPNAKGAEKMSELITKQGKILQPFTITSSRKDLQKKVFGTGQVLPSMSVEEYLDYELANGKMMKEEVKDPDKDEDATDNSDEEMEKRNWDDWKDENPKGMGNTGGNLG